MKKKMVLVAACLWFCFSTVCFSGCNFIKPQYVHIIVEGNSMYPTYEDGDEFYAKLTNKKTKLKRG